MTATMTKGERAELGALIRKRERVMKAAARERSSQLIAEFDTQSAQIYSFDDDEVLEGSRSGGKGSRRAGGRSHRGKVP